MLETARLVLQTPAGGDRPLMMASGSDPDAQRWLGWLAHDVIPQNRIDQLLVLEPGRGRGRLRLLDSCWLLAIDQDSGLVAGAAALNLRSREVGGWLAPRFRGRGLGTELFVGIAVLGHDHMGIGSVRAGTDPANTPCVAALLAAGFRPAPGPQVHQLPDGRTVPARWLENDADQPARCPAWRTSVL